MNDEHYMQIALDTAARGVAEGQSPFGACIVIDENVIACEHNMVIGTNDPTAHAEVRTIRAACEHLQVVHLEDAAGARKSAVSIYSTTEPCPMCFSAIHWARIGRIVSGCSITDAAEFGFNELPITNTHLCEVGDCEIQLVPGVLRNQCRALFKQWKKQGGRAY